jgi:NADH:ubiquinone oxidoreductase subunit 3 (subunit A)
MLITVPFLILIILFIVVLFILPTAVGFFYKTFSSDTETAYECGFVPFSEGQMQFTITFYVVSVLFILFDLEIVFLFPLFLGILNQTIVSFCAASLFLLILGIGFVIEFQILSD